MNPKIVKSLTTDFESNKHQTKEGLDFWYARDLQKLLEYKEWRNFEKIVKKAQKSCRNTGVPTQDHFVDVNKEILAGKGATLDTNDIVLTRYACYLIAQNGDPSKSQIAFAQAYFAVQTRKLELLEEKINQIERIKAREKLSKSEKQLSGIIYERTKNEKAFGYIRSKGDEALFGLSTAKIKSKWNIPKSKPLADFAPTVVLKGKDFANEMTVFNTQEKDLKKTREITEEHIENNQIVRNAMKERGIIPENLKPEADVVKVKRKLNIKKKELKELL
ncbi:TPA: DNA damage-inducible protein D [Patescibacteria group bacterium]|nr:DNA damage-inducible protein D [Patescibacteria group bacterium]